MSAPYWKVCGITNAPDARAAVEAGAAALGFVLWPGSPRAVDLETAAGVAAQIPAAVQKIGVFVDASPGELEEAAARVPLDVLQLAGDEPPEACGSTPTTTWKSLRLAADTGEEEAKRLAASYADCTLLIDAAVPGEYGGTGERSNWSLAASLAASRHIVLAGGLDADNVAAAIDNVRPWGIDVSSGVEESPGKKDHDELRRFAAVLEAYR